jgi:hypothetical protein
MPSPRKTISELRPRFLQGRNPTQRDYQDLLEILFHLESMIGDPEDPAVYLVKTQDDSTDWRLGASGFFNQAPVMDDSPDDKVIFSDNSPALRFAVKNTNFDIEIDITGIPESYGGRGSVLVFNNGDNPIDAVASSGLVAMDVNTDPVGTMTIQPGEWLIMTLTLAPRASWETPGVRALLNWAPEGV